MKRVAAALVGLTWSGVAAAQATAPGLPPTAIARVLDCRTVTDPAERLACFDREVSAMNQARASGELLTIDRQQAQKTRRSLFGLALPNLGIFGDNDPASPVQPLETTVSVARQDAAGRWIFDLAEGGRWQQLDTRELIVEPRNGTKIRIRRAATGSYLANVNGETAIRVQRLK
jgi:hypothetical protein